MTETHTRGPTAAGRRVGYVVGALIGAVLLYLINVAPGWRAVPFLTADTEQVLWLVNASVIAGIVTNLAYLVRDSGRVTALGGIVTTGFGIAAMARIWQVFPFDFAGYYFNWPLLIRVVLIVGIAGSAIAIIANGAKLWHGDAAKRS